MSLRRTFLSILHMLDQSKSQTMTEFVIWNKMTFTIVHRGVTTEMTGGLPKFENKLTLF